jgi:hypothetical protein
LISYDPFENERQILMTRTITALQGHSGSEVIQLAYNPWAGDKLLFLKREAARGPENSLINYSSGGEIVRKNTVSGDSYSVRVDLTTSVVSQNLKKSYISAMSMQFLKRDYANYEINSNLNLILAHQYRLKFTSALIRKTLDQGTVLQVITVG